MSIAGDLNHPHVTDVAEMAVEPSYISEIARKLQDVDPSWQTMSENHAVQRVAKAVQALIENNENIEVYKEGYESFGGQRESSAKLSLGEGGMESTNKWRKYAIIHNTETHPDDVQDHIWGVIDPDVTVDEKIDIADFISRQGNRTAKFSERIIQDHILSVVDDPGHIERSDYNDPGLDVYVEDFRSSFSAELTYERGLGIEISTRWVNPIDVPYISSKINSVMDMESKRGVQVDLMILAPKFTAKAENKYDDSDIVTIADLPFEPEGNPIIIEDDQDTIGQAQGTNLVGPEYPIVDGFFEQFQDDLSYVQRKFDIISELDYRRQMSTVIGQVF